MRWTFPPRSAPRKPILRRALSLEGLEAREVPTASPYLVPANPSVATQTILTVGDATKFLEKNAKS